MDVPEAVEAVLTIKPEVVIPMHRIEADLKKFKKQVEESSDVKVILLNQNEKFEFK
jgi:L-ascorbate metabolism protein UlaG (beta-lactamase superfamily)